MAGLPLHADGRPPGLCACPGGLEPAAPHLTPGDAGDRLPSNARPTAVGQAGPGRVSVRDLRAWHRSHRARVSVASAKLRRVRRGLSAGHTEQRVDDVDLAT